MEVVGHIYTPPPPRPPAQGVAWGFSLRTRPHVLACDTSHGCYVLHRCMGHLSPDPRDHSLIGVLLLSVCLPIDWMRNPSSDITIPAKAMQAPLPPTRALHHLMLPRHAHKCTHMLPFTTEARQITLGVIAVCSAALHCIYARFTWITMWPVWKNNCKVIRIHGLTHVPLYGYASICFTGWSAAGAVTYCLCCWSWFVVSNCVKPLHLVSGLTPTDTDVSFSCCPVWLQFDPWRHY